MVPRHGRQFLHRFLNQSTIKRARSRKLPRQPELLAIGVVCIKVKLKATIMRIAWIFLLKQISWSGNSSTKPWLPQRSSTVAGTLLFSNSTRNRHEATASLPLSLHTIEISTQKYGNKLNKTKPDYRNTTKYPGISSNVKTKKTKKNKKTCK